MNNKIFEFKIQSKKIGSCQLTFAKRLVPILGWLKRRYKIKSENVSYNHYFKDDEDKENKLITVKLTFK